MVYKNVIDQARVGKKEKLVPKATSQKMFF
jgi:hypothetical protein